MPGWDNDVLGGPKPLQDWSQLAIGSNEFSSMLEKAGRLVNRNIGDGEASQWVPDAESGGVTDGSFLFLRQDANAGGWRRGPWPVSTDTKSTAPLNRTAFDTYPSGTVPTFAFPIIDKTYDPAIDMFYREQPDYHPDWPRIPGGMSGFVTAAVDYQKQVPIYLHGDPRLVAVNFAGDPFCGSLVCDLNADDELDTDRCARLQSAWRVVLTRNGCGDFKVTGALNGLAWQLGYSGQDKIAGLGMTYDTENIPAGFTGSAAGSDRGIVGLFGMKAYGPFDVGDYVDQHQIGVTADGEPINSGHITTDAYFHGHGGDAPLHFQAALYREPPKQPLKTRVHLRYDPKIKHPHVCGEKDGMWRWIAEAMFDIPPTDQPPPPPGPGPGPGPGGGGGGAGGGGAGGAGGGPGPKPKPIPDFETPGLIGPAEIFRLLSQEMEEAFRSRAVDTPPEAFGSTTVQTSFPAILMRPTVASIMEADLRSDRNPTDESIDWYNATAPVTLRMEGFGQVVGSTPIYTQAPGDGRFRPGTSNGGMLFVNPELDLADYETSFEPDEITKSTSYVVMTPGVNLGFGLPDLTTGGVKSAHVLIGDIDTPANPGLEFACVNHLGTQSTIWKADCISVNYYDDIVLYFGDDVADRSAHFFEASSGNYVTDLTSLNSTNVWEVRGGLTGFEKTDPVSTLETGGSFGATVTTVTATTPLDASYYCVLVNNSAAANILLPTSSTSANRIYVIKKISATGGGRTVTIVPATIDGQEYVDGQTTHVINKQYDTIMIQCDGSDWFII